MRAPSLALLRATLDRPLVLFLLGGGVLFAATASEPATAPIAVDRETLAARAAAEAARRGVARLDDEALRAVEARALEDELLVREALRLELDRGDPLIRQRLVQKVLFLAEDLGGASEPVTRDALQRFFDEEPTRFAEPPRTELIHVFSTQPPPPELRETLTHAWADATTPPPLGDAYVGPRALTVTEAELIAAMGSPAAQAIAALPVGSWSPPIRGTHGWHHARVLARHPARIPRFEDVAKRVELAYLVARKARAVDAFLREAAARHGVDPSRLTREARVAPEVEE